MTAGNHRNGTLLLLLALGCRAYGLDTDRTVREFFHSSWTVSDGGPSGLTQMAQTTDGYLWLGTQTGLIRFDGLRFERYEPANGKLPSNTISALLATPEGGLWIGFAPHGAALLKGGKVVFYGEREGLRAAPVYAFGRDGEGTIWLGTSRGLSRFTGSAWQAVGSDRGFPEASVEDFFLDRQKRFWVSTSRGLFCRLPHGQTFERRSDKGARLGQSKDGTIWIAESHHFRRLSSSQPAIDLDASALLVDRDNGMWVLTSGDGIARIRKPEESAEIEHFTRQDGLSDNRITSALEDHEGNIWVATRGGLDRFRRRNVVPSPFPYGTGAQDLALVADRSGSVWAGSLDRPLMQLQKGTVSLQSGVQKVSCAYRDLDGTLWFGGEGTLTRFSNGRLEDVAMPGEIKPSSFWTVQAITRDPLVGLWVSVTQNGVFRLHDGLWIRWGNLAALPKRTAVSMWTDHQGRVWFGYTENVVAVWDGNSVRTFSSPEGLQVGTVTAISGSGDRVWVGGQTGLAIFEGARFRMIGDGADGQFEGVSGIIELPNGDLWLNQARGVVHIPAAEIASARKNKLYYPRYELFDFRDGVAGIASPLRPLPSAILASDGRIWLSGTNGVSWIDPARIYRNPVPPPVAIGPVIVDGQRIDVSAPATLPVLPSNVRIEYTALSLSIPERVHFRYRLEGFDRDWQDAETRRAAFYTRLGPGRYRFHVIACNNDGVWNTTGASLDLVVPPAFYQTSWFMALGLSAAGGLLYGLYLLRLRQMSLRMQGRLEERLAERERIARELHDTLLQGIQGLILRFQAAAKRIPPSESARSMLEDALDRADEVMLEGRNRVRDLRAHTEAGNALSEDLTVAGTELSRDDPRCGFRMVVEGTPEELHPLVRDEAYRIGREALVNAFCHAGAREIEVELSYKSTELRLRVRDDGRGIDPKILDVGGRQGHWGLTGMRERAEKMGAHLDIRSRPGAGTEVELRVPATIAYRSRVSGSLFRWPRRVQAKGSHS